MSLSNKNTGMMDRLSKRAAEYSSLESSLEELMNGKT